MKPPFDLAVVDSATGPALEAGHRIFQTHRYAKDDAGHVAFLLEKLDPKPDAMVLDAGCGIGEVSRLMSIARPDLAFVLMNVSALQLSHCPTGEQYLHALDDCHASLLTDESMDAVMFSSALCQMDIDVALAEAFRVLKDGGVLLVNDMAHLDGAPEGLEQAIAARVLRPEEWVHAVGNAGFLIDFVSNPDADDTHFSKMAEDAGILELIEGIIPIVIRAEKRKEAL